MVGECSVHSHGCTVRSVIDVCSDIRIEQYIVHCTAVVIVNGGVMYTRNYQHVTMQTMNSSVVPPIPSSCKFYYHIGM